MLKSGKPKCASATAQIKHEADVIGWPELTGSQKQIDWAVSLRKNFYDRFMANNPSDDGLKMVEWLMATKGEAKYWIDNRVDFFGAVEAAAAEYLGLSN